MAALVLTHGHFDHIGFAERARTTLGIDASLAALEREQAPILLPGHGEPWREGAAAAVAAARRAGMA